MCRGSVLGILGGCPPHGWTAKPRSRGHGGAHTVSQREQRHQGCLTELHQAGARLDRERFWWRPSWQALRDGARPEEHVVGEPGEWQHGWQYWASSISDSYFRKTSLLPVRPAHLRSHSGPNAGAALACAPTAPEYTISSLVPGDRVAEAPVATPHCRGDVCRLQSTS